MKAGFARLDITPPLGICIAGYFDERRVCGILDPLQAHAVAFSDGEKTAAVVSLDVIGICQKEMDILRRRAAERNNIPYEAVFVACTHTHTGPEISERGDFPNDPHYNEYLFSRISDAISLAIEDMRETRVEIARGEARGISFVRRFRMKDGSTRTNPGNDPNVVAPIGTPDETVQLVKLVREGAADIAIVNFQVHPDVIGGSRFCSDYPGYVRRTLEGALQGEKGGQGVHVVYFNGAQGDTNHIDIRARRNGSAQAEHMGRVIAGAVLSVYSRTEPVAVDGVVYGQKAIQVPSNKGTAEEVAEAKVLRKLYEEDHEKFHQAVNRDVMAMGRILRLLRLENEPDSYELYLTAVGFGEVVFAGLPGEPFTDIGRGIKQGSPFAMTVPCCCANGYQGYYPMRDCYEEGGYEATSSNFKAGVAERLIETSVALTKELKG